jgi:hypothetical protein
VRVSRQNAFERGTKEPSDCSMLITLVTLGILFAFAGSLLAGRLGALGTTVLYGAAIAFFWMPPRFSIRVTQPQDIAALAFYGVAGLVLAGTSPGKKKRGRAGIDRAYGFGSRPRGKTDLSRAVASIMSSELGSRLHARGFTSPGAAVILPCTRQEIVRILSDILTEALQAPDVQRISIGVGRRPNVIQLTVAAYRNWPPPLGDSRTIGKRDQDCEELTIAGWPSHSRATWFDNGYGRIFQVSIEANR